ncbi:FAD-dependent monooxygenase [Thiococcus pfennigii]|uniref:FAD-dependent monooxygenase n=1 Tax=Thiococcus pfennigii TaxID=1057 RepID=UPI0030B89B2C
MTPQWVEVQVAEGGVSERLRTRLLVAADGGDSSVRRLLGIGLRERPYGQDALIATLTPDRPQPGVAFERFTESGPLALLPMTEGRWSLVWSVPQDRTAGLLALSDEAFLARIQGYFGWRLGRLARTSPRRAFPLVQRLASEATRPRVVLIGNAAHTLHPVAGQGLNLGLRDVAALAEVLVAARRAGDDVGGTAALAAYRDWRRRDQAEVAATTDLLARLFVGGWPPLRAARDLGLLGIELVPGLRHQLARRFMGRAGRQTRLARGLPLETLDG